jgi:hypothetical protein
MIFGEERVAQGEGAMCRFRYVETGQAQLPPSDLHKALGAGDVHLLVMLPKQLFRRSEQDRSIDHEAGRQPQAKG